MEQTSENDKDCTAISAVASAAASSSSTSRWTKTWSTGTSHRHHIIAECPGCLAEHGRSHVCGIVDELAPTSTSLDFQMRVKSHHPRAVELPVDSPSQYQYSPSTSFPNPPGVRCAYGLSSAPSHYANYPAYSVGLDRPRCACGDLNCPEVALNNLYDITGHPSHPIRPCCPNHVALPQPAGVYPGHGHRLVYPGEHYPVIGSSSPAHYHHVHSHNCPPGGAYLLHQSVAAMPYQMTGEREFNDSARMPNIPTSPSTTVTSVNLQVNSTNRDTADDGADLVLSNSASGDGSSMGLITDENDVTPSRGTSSALSTSVAIHTHAQSSGTDARAISQSLSALTSSGSSDCIPTSTTSSVTSHGGSTDLVPERDVTPDTAASTQEADATGDVESKDRSPHHGSMTFIVDIGGGGGRDGSAGSTRNPATPLSECLPQRLRRKSVQHRIERESREEEQEAETRRKGMSPLLTRRFREGVTQTSRMAAMNRSPVVTKRQTSAKISSHSSRTAVSSDDDAEQSMTTDNSRVKRTVKKQQNGVVLDKTETTRKSGDSDFDLTLESSATTTSRARKNRQLTGTETELMQQMLFPTTQPNSARSRQEQVDKEPEYYSAGKLAIPATRWRDSKTDIDTLALKKKSETDSDNESNASADTYTIDSDGKEEVRQERARIDDAFGIVSDSTTDAQIQSSATGSSLLHESDGHDEDSLQIHEDSDEEEQHSLKRTKNQTLFHTDANNCDGLAGQNGSSAEDRNFDFATSSLDQNNMRNNHCIMQSFYSEADGDYDEPSRAFVGVNNNVAAQGEHNESLAAGTSTYSFHKATSLKLETTKNDHDEMNAVPASVSDTSNTEDVILCIHESGDEVETIDNDTDKNVEQQSDTCSSKMLDVDTSSSPSDLIGRRLLPAPPTTDRTDSGVATTVAQTVQPRKDADVKSTTNNEDNRDNGSFVIVYDAPPVHRDLHLDVGNRSEHISSAESEWATTMRSLAESKLQTASRRRTNSRDEESSTQLNVVSPTAKRANSAKSSAAASTVADLTHNGAKITRNVIVSSGRQLPATSDRFVPIANGESAKPPKYSQATAASTAAASRSKPKGPSGAPNSGGSRSARTTPLESSSPTKDLRQIRTRSKSNTGEEFERTKTSTTTSAGTRKTRPVDSNANNMRWKGVSGDPIRRSRPHSDLATDSAVTSTRQQGGRGVTARQNPLPPVPVSTRLRSTSQKRPGETSAVTRYQQAQTVPERSRSQYGRSPERGRTSTRQSDIVSRSPWTSSSRNLCRSSSATVLTTTQRRAASRSPQRPLFANSAFEQERRNTARENLKKRMAYDASKSAALGRTATVVRRSELGLHSGTSQQNGSTERLSTSSGDSRRSSRGSVSGLSDEEAFGRSAAAVAQYSSSVACDISALSHRVSSGRNSSSADDDEPVSTAYDRILLRSILQMSENVKQCSDRLHNHFRESVGNSAALVDKSQNNANTSRRASDCTMKLEEILHNLAYADRRLQSCSKMCSTTARHQSNSSN